MNKQYLGQATLEYSPEGELLKAVFVPKMEIKLDQPTVVKLQESVSNNTKFKQLKHNADMVLASWFSAITEIELADRESYTIVSEAVICDKYPDKTVQKCVIDYYFQPTIATQAQA